MTTATETYINTPTESRGRRRTTLGHRDVGSEGELPLVLIHHFRGNLEIWDPPPVDALESNRRGITFDYAVGGSTGQTEHTVAEMALGTLAFLDALGLEQADVLGFSIGSFVAQDITLTKQPPRRSSADCRKRTPGGSRFAAVRRVPTSVIGVD
jgi:pimeloyl-ACP methyl ester carboxylesterase